jgi:hypothetical protein
MRAEASKSHTRSAAKSLPRRKHAAATPPADCPESGPAQRSRVTNGSAFVIGDNRSPWVRRAKDLVAEHLADLGGVEMCSAAQRSIVRRAAVLEIELESLEAKFSAAGQASASDLDLYGRSSGNLRRLLESLGLERRCKDISPTLDDIAADIAASRHEAPEAVDEDNYEGVDE